MPKLCDIIKQRIRSGLCIYPGFNSSCKNHYACIDLREKDPKKQEMNYIRIQTLNSYIEKEFSS